MKLEYIICDACLRRTDTKSAAALGWKGYVSASIGAFHLCGGCQEKTWAYESVLVGGRRIYYRDLTPSERSLV